jgi:hypothetical protein
MIYNPKIERDRERAVIYFDSLMRGSDKFIIEKKQKKRTLDQNSLYWLWLACIEDETGNEKNYLHEVFKDKYCPALTKNIFGEETELKSTKFLSTKGMSKYMGYIEVFAQVELNIKLPYPEEKGFDEFYEKYKYYG